MQEKINGRNAVSGKIAGSCSLVIVEPAPDVKRVDDWALDVAVPVTVKRYENVRKKRKKNGCRVCIYSYLKRLTSRIPHSFQIIRKFRDKVKG